MAPARPRELELETERGRARRVRHVYVQTQSALPPPPPPLLPPWGCADCEQAVALLPANRGGEEEAGEEQGQSKIRNFFTWVSSKAGQHTTALLDSFPLKGGGKYLQIIMIGLDGAGKTTALYMMKLDQYLNTVPTVGFNCERVKGSIGSSAGTTFLVWDVGGQEKIRPLWRTYTRNTDGIIFVLDAADYRSFEQARIGEFYWPSCAGCIMV